MNVARIAASGVYAATRKLAVSAHNVANVNTEGFKAQTEVVTEQKTGGVQSQTVASAAPSPVYERDGHEVLGSNTSLINETLGRIHASRAFQANLSVLRADDQTQRSLIDLRA